MKSAGWWGKRQINKFWSPHYTSHYLRPPSHISGLISRRSGYSGISPVEIETAKTVSFVSLIATIHRSVFSLLYLPAHRWTRYRYFSLVPIAIRYFHPYLTRWALCPLPRATSLPFSSSFLQSPPMAIRYTRFTGLSPALGFRWIFH
jgi:hypothetical protein